MGCGCTDGICGCVFATSNTVAFNGNGTGGSPFFGNVITDPVGGLSASLNGVLILVDPDPCNLLSTSIAGALAQLVVEDSPSVHFTGCGTADDPLTATVDDGPGSGVASFSTGMVMMTASNIAPFGWTLADGQSRDSIADPDYADLYALIGTTYGGTGPADFNMPPLSCHFVVGAGALGGFTTRPLGSQGGEEDHTLTTAELASHFHTIPAGSTNASPVDAGMGTIAGADPGADYTICTASGGGIGVENIEASGHSHPIPAHQTNPFGSDAAHNNMPPFVALNYIIAL